MPRHLFLLLLAGLGLLGGGCAAPSGPLATPSATVPRQLRQGARSLATGFGLTSDPNAPLVTVDLQYAPLDHFTVGPKLQVAMSDKTFLFAPTLNVKNTFVPPLPFMDRCLGYLQGGVGFVYLDKDRTGTTADDDDLALLVNVGAGLEIPLDDGVTLGTGFMLNYAPDGVLDEDWFLSWEILSLRFWF